MLVLRRRLDWEFPNRGDPVHVEASTHKRKTPQFRRETAEAAGAGDPAELGDEVMVLFEGAITLQQVTQDDHAATTARRVAAKRVHDAIAQDN